MKSIKNRVLVSFLALALVMTSVFTPSVSAEAASKKAVKSVTLKVGSKKVNKKTQKLTVGKSLTVKTTVSPSSAKKKVTYKSSNKKVATVSSKGKVKAKKAGTAKITVTVKGKNNKTKSAWFKVKVVKKATPTKKPTATPKPTKKPTATPTATPAPQEVEVTKVSLTAFATTISAGQTTQVYAEVQPTNATNKSVTFKSSDETVATVTNTGLVTALKDGQTTITATAANGIAGTIVISVKTVDPVSMSLNVSTLDLTVGDTSVLGTVFVPENTTERKVTWSSDKESVAKVDANNGTVTAIGAGTATITATSENGLTATCTVTVKEKTNDKTNGVTIDVANSLADYENTVFTGNNADIKVRVYKDGKPVGNTDVTLKMEHKSANDYWYISNNQSSTSTVKTDSQGIASFTISLIPGYDYDATDGVMGGYLLTATATGASTTAQEPLTFARFTVGSAKGRVATTNYSFSNITVNGLTDLVQGKNANEKGISDTKTIERKMINVKEDENELIGTSEYVVSQQVSTVGTQNHAVTFDAAPLIQYPEVITGTDDNDYKKDVNFACEGYTVYDTSKFTYIAEVPTNLNYATLNFKSAIISKNTALKIEVYKDYDADTNEPIGSAIKTYAIKGEHVEKNFGFQIPIQELARIDGVEDYICIKVYVQSQGQVDVDKAIGFNLVNITGNYVGTSKYKNVSEIYADASIDWKQVQVGEVGSDAYLYANYQSKVTMTDAEAQAYGIPVQNPGDTYYNATVEYKIPTYPHIGNAYVTVTKPNSKEDTTYFMIPTETVNNENKLISSDRVQAFRVTEEEAMDYVGTVTTTDSTITVNSEKSGITEVYGFLTVPELDYLTLEERRLFAYVDWAPIPEEEVREITDFYALVGQTITVDVLVTDNNGNPQSDKEVEFYLAKEKDNEVKLTRENLTADEGVTITNDSSKFDETKSTVKTDKDGIAHITFRSDSYKNGIIARELSANCTGFNVKMSVDGTVAEYARLYWVAPGLSFTDQTQVNADETKDEIAQNETTKLSYELASKDAGQTATQEKKIDSTWLIGYQVVGLVEGSDYETAQAAAAAGFSNVIIKGVGADITLNGSGSNEALGKSLATDKENATIKITSEKTGLDLIKGSVSKESIDEEAIVYFTILDEFGVEKYTVKNVGKGETSAQVGLNIPIKWVPVDMDYEILTPSGDTFAIDEKLISKKLKETVYVKVSDSKGNLLDDYEVTYSVKKTAKGVTSDVIAEAKATSKNGLVPVTFDIPTEECTYEITATIEGNETKTKSITYVERAESTVDFGMKTAAIDETANTITVTLSDKVNASTVDKEMFTIVDNTNKSYTVSSVVADGQKLVFTLGNNINSSSTFINITYNEVAQNIEKKRLARRMVSNTQSGIMMEDGFTVTAYTSAIPEIEYAGGVVSATKGSLPANAYVIFTYNTTVVKCVQVGADGTAIDTAAATAEDVVAFTGTAASNETSNAAVNAPAATEEVVETVVATEATAEETTTEVVEEAVAEVVAE
ncbi:MAG: Ig-like domain-containing protein [Lachnospiraceae bacterium]|nr:Ig-like domain-containing protein [Lachnospiraceae bacterium]